MLNIYYFSEKRVKKQVDMRGMSKIVKLPYTPSAGKHKTAGAIPRRLFRSINSLHI